LHRARVFVWNELTGYFDEKSAKKSRTHSAE